MAISFLFLAGIAFLQVSHHCANAGVFGAKPIPTTPEEIAAQVDADKIQKNIESGMPTDQVLQQAQNMPGVPGGLGGLGGGLFGMPGKFIQAGTGFIPATAGIGRQMTMGALNAGDYGTSAFSNAMSTGGNKMLDTMGQPMQGIPLVGGAFNQFKNAQNTASGFGENLRSRSFGMGRSGLDKGFGMFGAHDDGITQQGYHPPAVGQTQQGDLMSGLNPSEYMGQVAQLPGQFGQTASQIPGQINGLAGNVPGMGSAMNQLNPNKI